MNVNVKFTPSMLGAENELRGATAVVIDTLRATSTIITALMAGAREVIAAATIEEAVGISHRLGTDRTLLGGERGGLKINGFHLGNSPAEYTPEVVSGKTIVLTTTNGALALVKSRQAAHVHCGALLNASAVAEALALEGPAELVFMCGGSGGNFSLEDTIAVGAILSRLAERVEGLRLTDGARVARAIYSEVRHDLPSALSISDHGQALIELGFEHDVRYCAQTDLANAPVPTLIGSSIKPRVGA